MAVRCEQKSSRIGSGNIRTQGHKDISSHLTALNAARPRIMTALALLVYFCNYVFDELFYVYSCISRNAFDHISTRVSRAMLLTMGFEFALAEGFDFALARRGQAREGGACASHRVGGWVG
jgi:hypothetical protein